MIRASSSDSFIAPFLTPFLWAIDSLNLSQTAWSIFVVGLIFLVYMVNLTHLYGLESTVD